MTNLTDGYPWGIWIAFDVVVGTALGCGGYAVALLVYILNKGEYHPLVRPAVLTSLLGYGLAVLAVIVDLGRYWDLWKIPIFFWQWSHSPQLEVAHLRDALQLRAARRALAGAVGEAGRRAPGRACAAFATKALRFVDKGGVWIIALGILLPTMHQSSLGTMMLLAGPRLHPLWFTPWLPFLFLVSCLVMGYGIVVCEASFAAKAFGRPRETAMLGRLAKVAKWVALFFVVFRIGDVALAGELGLARFAARRGVRRRARDASGRRRRPDVRQRGAPIRSGRCARGSCSILARHAASDSTPISSPSTRASTIATSRRCPSS